MLLPDLHGKVTPLRHDPLHAMYGAGRYKAFSRIEALDGQRRFGAILFEPGIGGDSGHAQRMRQATFQCFGLVLDQTALREAVKCRSP